MAEEFPNHSERPLKIDRRELLSTAVGKTFDGNQCRFSRFVASA